MQTMGSGRIPTTIVTGFLGAGKTSLLRHVMGQAGNTRFAVIVNEFGDLGVDGELLRDCGAGNCMDEDIVELANGCLCCTVADDFLPTMQKLLARDDQLDHILIETSGLALPKPLVRAFNWPGIRNRFTVDGVIAVVDAVATADGLFAPNPKQIDKLRQADPALDHETPLEELFEEQIQCADLIILNKTDAIDADARERAEQIVNTKLRPGAHVLTASHGRVDPRLLLSIDAEAESDLESRPSHHDGEDDHDHDDFESFVVSLARVDDIAKFANRLEQIARNFKVLRMKGFVEVTGKPMRLAVQAVGSRITHYFDRPWNDDEGRNGSLVIIGQQGLDRITIERQSVQRYEIRRIGKPSHRHVSRVLN